MPRVILDLSEIVSTYVICFEARKVIQETLNAANDTIAFIATQDLASGDQAGDIVNTIRKLGEECEAVQVRFSRVLENVDIKLRELKTMAVQETGTMVEAENRLNAAIAARQAATK